MGSKRAQQPAMKAWAIAPRQRALRTRRADGGNVADEGEQTTHQPTIDFRREKRMVAAPLLSSSKYLRDNEDIDNNNGYNDNNDDNDDDDDDNDDEDHNDNNDDKTDDDNDDDNNDDDDDDDNVGDNAGMQQPTIDESDEGNQRLAMRVK